MKNTRNIVGIIAFIGTFAASSGLVWLLFGFPAKQVVNYSHHNCSQRYAGAVYSHLQRDIRNGRERDIRSFRTNDWESNGRAEYSLKNHADSVEIYVEDSRNMDVSDFPRDFQIAWNKHIDAWEDYSEFLNEKKTSSKSKSNQKSSVEFESPYDDEINHTWYEVLRIGRNYGAFVE